MSVLYGTFELSATAKRAHALSSTAAGHAVAARGGDGATRPENREPTARPQAAAGILAPRGDEDVKCATLRLERYRPMLTRARRAWPPPRSAARRCKP